MYSFSNFINECLHPEAIHALYQQGRVHPRGLNYNDDGDNEPAYEFPICAPLVYDTEQAQLEIGTQPEDKLFDTRRFIILGLTLRYTQHRAECISPYFIKLSVDPTHFKNSASLMKHIRKSVADENDALRKVFGDEAEFSMLNKADVDLIDTEIHSYIAQFDNYAMYNKIPVSSILKDEIIVYEDGGNVALMLGGFGPDYYNAFIPVDYAEEYAQQSEYKQLSPEEFFQRMQQPVVSYVEETDSEESEEEPDPQKSSYNCHYQFVKFKEAFPRVTYMECWLPLKVTVKIG